MIKHVHKSIIIELLNLNRRLSKVNKGIIMEAAVEEPNKLAYVYNVVFANSRENLAILAKHCSLETLKNLRHVSHHFYNASLDAWRKRTVLRIDAVGDLGLGIQPERGYLDIVEFFGMVDNPEKDLLLSFIGSKPSPAFKLKLHENYRQLPHTGEFIKRFGHQIFGVHLFCFFNLFSDRGDNFRQLHEDFKNVKEITFEHCILELSELFGAPVENIKFEMATTVKLLDAFVVTRDNDKDREMFLSVFPNNKELHLCGRFECFNNFDFLQWTPLLRKLVIDRKKDRDVLPMVTKKSRKRSSPPPDLVENTVNFRAIPIMEYLVHLELDSELSDKSWGRLVEVIPNLKVLKTILNNKSLGVICRLWRQLKELCLMLGSQVDDEGITGIGKWNDPNKDERFPNLTSLEELTDFEVMAYTGRSKITELSVFHGFLKMLNLKSLTIWVSPKMTAEAEELLNSKISFVKIYK